MKEDDDKVFLTLIIAVSIAAAVYVFSLADFVNPTIWDPMFFSISKILPMLLVNVSYSKNLEAAKALQLTLVFLSPIVMFLLYKFSETYKKGLSTKVSEPHLIDKILIFTVSSFCLYFFIRGFEVGTLERFARKNNTSYFLSQMLIYFIPWFYPAVLKLTNRKHRE